MAQILNLEHIHQFEELLGHLLNHLVVTGHHHGEAGDAGPLRMAYGKTLDVESAAGKEPRNAAQHACLILHQDGKSLLHEGVQPVIGRCSD